MKRLLLHICCGPCATHSVELLSRDYAVTGFFSNSNIAPRSEYGQRLASAQLLAGSLGFPMIEDAYDHEAWLETVAGLENEPEGGARCERCFVFNLARAAQYATDHGFELFTTTLSISPHKDTPTLFRVGRELGPFLEIDLKQQDGFRRSIELSRELGLYRQDYCGCEFSREL